MWDYTIILVNCKLVLHSHTTYYSGEVLYSVKIWYLRKVCLALICWIREGKTRVSSLQYNSDMRSDEDLPRVEMLEQEIDKAC